MTTQSYHMFVKTLTTSSSMFQETKLKTCTQKLKHEKYRNQANQEQPQPFFMMSPQICQQLQVLNAFKNVALAIVIERHMTTKRTSNNQKNDMQTKLCLLRQSACLTPF